MTPSTELSQQLEGFLQRQASRENSRRRSMWRELAQTGRDQFRPTPLFDSSWKMGALPFTVDVQNPTWAKLLGFNLRAFYTDAQTFLLNYFKIMNYRFDNFADDTFLEKSVPLWGTSAMEGSLFGMQYRLSAETDPWLEHSPLIRDEADVQRFLQHPPAFRTAGLMPTLIQLYEECVTLLPNDFSVHFPVWNRSSFGIATYLRGYENFLVDTLSDPDFALSQLEMITAARAKWFEDLSRYLGAPIPKGSLYNDEMNCPTISPDFYEQSVLPLEQQLSAFHKGIYYWHSCGNVTRLLPSIAKIPDLELFNCGPWTDVFKAAQTFRGKCPIEVCMNPQVDILEGTPQSMREKIRSVILCCAQADIEGFFMKISALNMQISLTHTISQVENWVQAMREIRDVLPSLLQNR